MFNFCNVQCGFDQSTWNHAKYVTSLSDSEGSTGTCTCLRFRLVLKPRSFGFRRTVVVLVAGRGGSESIAPLAQSHVAVVGLLVVGAADVLEPVDEEVPVLLQDQELFEGVT